jgi:hypothetical protein
MLTTAFRGRNSEFAAYLAGIKSGKVVDLAWYRHKKKAAKRAADIKNL